MDKKTESNGNHFYGVTNGGLKLKEMEARVNKNNNKKTQKNTIVTITSGGRGCYFSRVQVSLFVFVLLLTLGVVVVLVVCYTGAKHYQKNNSRMDHSCTCFNDHQTHEKLLSVQTSVPTWTTIFNITIEPVPSLAKVSNVPEINIRLPGDVLPVHYDILLDVDIANATCKGSVKILVDVVKETKLLLLHAKHYFMSINPHKVYVYPYKLNTKEIPELRTDALELKHQFKDIDTEIYAIKLKEAMDPDVQYIIEIQEFTNRLYHDMKGMYLSSYKNKFGVKR